jgi:4-hydroxybenzoate polyprenyltransferase
MNTATQTGTSRGLAWLRLCRAPNVFTALADVSMGYLVTNQSLAAWWHLIPLAGASALMYMAGMVLNDVFDFAEDAQQRPQRPLPSGQISREAARGVGWGLLMAGLALAWVAGLFAGPPAATSLRPGLVATLLALCIVAYDGGVKRTIAGPLFMGSCRFLNVLMGMSLPLASATGDSATMLGWQPGQLMIAAAIGTYIVGITVFARSEAVESRRGLLVLGLAIMAAGLGILAIVPAVWPNPRPLRMSPSLQWPVAVVVMSVLILRRCLSAISTPDPRHVQVAVKHCLLSLIVLDAMICVLYCPLPYALGILFLLVPTIILGRWVYST